MKKSCRLANGQPLFSYHPLICARCVGLEPAPLECQLAYTETGKHLESGLREIEVAEFAVGLGAHVDDGCDDLHVGSLLGQEDLLAAHVLAGAHLVLVDSDNEI